MWLITQIGFFSIVQKLGDEQAGTLTVHARVRGDLAALKQHYEVASFRTGLTEVW